MPGLAFDTDRAIAMERAANRLLEEARDILGPDSQLYASMETAVLLGLAHCVSALIREGASHLPKSRLEGGE